LFPIYIYSQDGLQVGEKKDVVGWKVPFESLAHFGFLENSCVQLAS